MHTLIAQRERLTDELAQARRQLADLRASAQPDLSSITALNDTITRNTQLIGMIDNHLGCGHQPMWRSK